MRAAHPPSPVSVDNARIPALLTTRVLVMHSAFLINTKPSVVVHLDWKEIPTSIVKFASVRMTVTVHKIIFVWRINVLIHVYILSVLLEPYVYPKATKVCVSAQQDIKVTQL